MSDDNQTYQVVFNIEEQYSIWPAHLTVPRGWSKAPFTGLKNSCLDYISEVWVDMRPLSLRKKIESSRSNFQIIPETITTQVSLVDLLASEAQYFTIPSSLNQTEISIQQILKQGCIYIELPNLPSCPKVFLEFDNKISDLAIQSKEVVFEAVCNIDFQELRFYINLSSETFDGFLSLKQQ